MSDQPTIIVQPRTFELPRIVFTTSVAFDGAFSSLSGKPTTLAGYGITDAQAASATLTALAGATTEGFGRSLLGLVDAAAARTAIGAGTSSFSGVYSALSGIPASFPPAAHSHAYSAITGIPATFPPAAHSHGWDGITDKPTAFPPAAHSHAYSAITGIPATFPPAAHSHGWDGITDKPTAFAPSAHNQAWSTITGKPTTLSGYGITDAQGLDADLTALAGLSANGLIARTGSGTAAARTITGTANQVIVANGDGVAGNPTLALPQSIATTSTPQFGGLTIGGLAKFGVADQGCSVRFSSFSDQDRGWTWRDDGGINRLRLSRGSSDCVIWDVLKIANSDAIAQQEFGGSIRFISYGAGTLVTDSSGNITAS